MAEVKRDDKTVGKTTKPKGGRDGMRGPGKPADKDYDK